MNVSYYYRSVKRMKKLLSLFMCLAVIGICSLPALGEGANTAVFSFSPIQGKKGDVVLVDFSLETENIDLAAFDLTFYYDETKLKFVKNPVENCWFTLSDFLNAGIFTGNEEILKTCFSTLQPINQKGKLITLAFQLLETIPTSENLVAGYFTSIINNDFEPIQRKFKGAWDSPIPSNHFYNPMKDNKITLSFGQAVSSPGEIVTVDLELSESYTYIRELDLQLSYDDTRLKPIGKGFFCRSEANYLEAIFDAQTKQLHIVCEEGMIDRGILGQLKFEVIEGTQKLEPVDITATLIKMPLHAKEQDFQYDITFYSGSVLAEFVEFKYEENEEGLTLVECSGNVYSNIQVPFKVDGKIVTAIGPKAFKNQQYLDLVFLSNYITEIAPDAFDGHETRVTLRVGRNSAARTFAQEHNINSFIDGSIADYVTGTDVLALGDANGDAFINAKDALIALRIAVKKEIPTPVVYVAANVNKDAFVDAKDALQMLRRSTNKSACF